MRQTRDQHVALDQQMGVFAGPGDYHAYLRGTYAFRASLEPVLAQGIGDPGWQPEYLLLPLCADMADLGLELAPPPAAPVLDSPAAIVAALYVVEGSALGARVIARRARELGFHDSHGARHLARQTAQHGRWPRFLEWMEGAGVSVDSATQAAQAVFGLALRAYKVDDKA